MNKKIKNIFEREFLITVCVIFLAILFYSNIRFDITGLAQDVYVNITELISGKITAFDYKKSLNLSEIQNITVEFTNTGTKTYETSIYETIYIYENGRLNTSAQFYDYEINLTPGGRRSFITKYQPPDYGTYYIKLLINYGNRRMETWGIFRVTTTEEGNETGDGEEPPPPGGGGGILYTITTAARRKTELTLDYPKILDMYPGQTIIIGVKAKNTGNRSLHDLGLYVSTPLTVDVDVSPKQVSMFYVNDSSMFLLTIHTKPEIPLGLHLINFEFVSRELKETGVIQLNVSEHVISKEKEVQNRILNNRYLILEIERQILSEFKRGINTTIPESYLNRAKDHLETADRYFNLADLDKAIDELDEKDENLRDSLFSLAHESFRVYYPPAFSPWWLLFIAIILGIIFLILMRRKKKKKKPKLLRRAEESET